MRGWKQRAERQHARYEADGERVKIRAIRQSFLQGGDDTEASPGETVTDAKTDLIPEWQALSWPDLRAVAKRLRGGAVRSKGEAVAVIETADESAFRQAFEMVTKRIRHDVDR